MKRQRDSVGHRSAPDPLARVVGERIRALRKDSAFTFDAFVEETGLGRGYVSELERGLVVPSLSTLHRVAQALEITVADLVLGESEREKLFADLRTVSPAELRKLRSQLHRKYQSAPAPLLAVADSVGPERRRKG